MTPALNKPIPEFEALATGGVKFTPQAYAGKIVILYFYPKDNTPGCTTEAMQFRDQYKEFVKAGAEDLVDIGLFQPGVPQARLTVGVTLPARSPPDFGKQVHHFGRCSNDRARQFLPEQEHVRD